MKCKECNKNIHEWVSFKCKCESVFCIKHRMSNDHACTYDYNENFKKKLEQSLVKVECPKVVYF